MKVWFPGESALVPAAAWERRAPARLTHAPRSTNGSLEMSKLHQPTGYRDGLLLWVLCAEYFESNWLRREVAEIQSHLVLPDADVVWEPRLDQMESGSFE